MLPVIFLVIAAGFTGFALVILFTMLVNIVVRVPSVPTPGPVVRMMIDLAQLRGDETVYDLGCGDARILIAAKKRYPGIRAIGYDLAPGAWIVAKIRIFLSRQKVEIRMRDFFGADLSDGNVFLLYLIPEVCRDLRVKFDRELKPGTRVISHGFSLSDKPAKEVVRCPLKSWGWIFSAAGKGPRIYVYEW
jgi:SAM-dependent methyltransferase